MTSIQKLSYHITPVVRLSVCEVILLRCVGSQWTSARMLTHRMCHYSAEMHRRVHLVACWASHNSPNTHLQCIYPHACMHKAEWSNWLCPSLHLSILEILQVSENIGSFWIVSIPDIKTFVLVLEQTWMQPCLRLSVTIECTYIMWQTSRWGAYEQG